MTHRTHHLSRLALAALFASTAAVAHVTLPPGGATAGSDYEAAFRVGHACKDAQATTGITVQLPDGFRLSDAQARKGWTLTSNPREVAWKAESPATALPGAERAEFIVRGKLTATPGPLYFKVLQTCDKGSADWAQLPGAGADKPAFPAARLDVLAPGVAAVDVRDAWVRPTVPGQSGTGAFMKLNAPSGARLVGVSTPASGVAEVHEMKMDGDTMRMREVKGGLALPARQTVELKPSGYHVMLMDLKQPLAKGATVPMTLRFEDAKGAASTLDVQVPVGAPAGAGAPAAHAH
ncbi:copper chaperone PCu(A)C [Variovorax sp. LT1P1]|uniref:copper chaperone PCu(A)C n=1 Tax=Variovorax sp. LT1P1 TaxID=3443730 RepID=UPI003F48A4F8